MYNACSTIMYVRSSGALHVYEYKIIPRRANCFKKFLILFMVLIDIFAAMIRLLEVRTVLQNSVQNRPFKICRGTKCANSYMNNGYSYKTKISRRSLYISKPFLT